jgi:hypothetical protein
MSLSEVAMVISAIEIRSRDIPYGDTGRQGKTL